MFQVINVSRIYSATDITPAVAACDRISWRRRRRGRLGRSTLWPWFSARCWSNLRTWNSRSTMMRTSRRTSSSCWRGWERVCRISGSQRTPVHHYLNRSCDLIQPSSCTEIRLWENWIWPANIVPFTTFYYPLFPNPQLLWWVQLWTQVRPPWMESCAQIGEVLARERRPPEREELRAPQVRRSARQGRSAFSVFRCSYLLSHFSWFSGKILKAE